MFIGELLLERMSAFGFNVNTLADSSFIDEDIISDLINNTMSLEEVDDFDLEMLCNTLYCTKEYFLNEQVRNKDMICSSLNRGGDTAKSAMVKGKIQSFLSDYIFTEQILRNM